MKIQGHEIDPSCIVSLNPDKRALLIKTKILKLHELTDFSMNGMIRVYVTDPEFQLAKFEYIKQLKARPNPEGRVDPFLECRAEDGGIDFKRMDELIELRKKPSEK